MSRGVRAVLEGVPQVRSHIFGEGLGVYLSSEVLCPGEGGLYSEVQCIMGCSHMRSPFPCGQIDMTENIIFPQLHWWAAIIHFAKINEDLSFELAS